MSDGAWEGDCKRWRWRVLTGKFAHWCMDWDGLPIDETCPEWPCACAKDMGATDMEIEEAHKRQQDFLDKHRPAKQNILDAG